MHIVFKVLYILKRIDLLSSSFRILKSYPALDEVHIGSEVLVNGCLLTRNVGGANDGHPATTHNTDCKGLTG